MADWWAGLEPIKQVFFIIAIPSTVIMLLQTVLLLFGLSGGDGGDADVHDGDVGMEADQGTILEFDSDHETTADGGFVPHSHSGYGQGPEHDFGLRVLTVRGVIAFMAICGWVGLVLLEFNVAPIIASLVAAAAGLVAMFLVAYIIRLSLKLQQSGNIDLRNAVGLVAEVYLPIHSGGKGKVTVVVQERFMELDAISDGQHEFKTGEQVRVIGLTESNILLVTPLNQTIKI